MGKFVAKYARPSETILSDLIRSNNANFQLPITELIFGVPVLIAGTQVSVPVSGNGLTAPQYEGAVSVIYNRLDLAQYFAGITAASIDGSAGTGDLALFNALLIAYKLYFNGGDAMGPGTNSQASWVVNTLSTPKTATLTVHAQNLIWQGSMVFTLSGV